MSGAVPIVAATVSAVASASAAGRRRRRMRSAIGAASSMIATTAAKLSCHPGSSAARGLSASVTAAARSSAYQRDAGRPAIVAATPAAPMTPARWIDGPPPASGTYSTIRPSARSSRARNSRPTSADRAEHERAEQHHVLAAGGDEVREPGESGSRRACAPAVPRPGRAPSRAAAPPAAEAGRGRAPLRALADPVERPGDTTAGTTGRSNPVGAQHGVDVARAQPGVGRPEALEDALDRELLAHPDAGPATRCSCGRAAAHARGGPSRCGPRRPRPRGLEQPDAHGGGVPEPVRQRRAVERARAARPRAPRRRAARRRPPARRPAGGEERTHRSAASTRTGARGPASRPTTAARQRRVERPGADLGEGRRRRWRHARADARGVDTRAAPGRGGQQASRSDAGHLAQVRHRSEPAVLRAPRDDLLGRRGTDAVERVELLGGGVVQTDRRPGARPQRPRPAGPGGRARGGRRAGPDGVRGRRPAGRRRPSPRG